MFLFFIVIGHVSNTVYLGFIKVFVGELSSFDRNAVIVDSVGVTEFVYKQEVRNSLAVLVINVQSWATNLRFSDGWLLFLVAGRHCVYVVI